MTLSTTEHMQAWLHECYILGIGPFCAFLRTVSQAEVQLLCERFQQLGPDKDGRLNRTVFQKPPYSTDPFSRQVIYIAPSCSSNNYSYHKFICWKITRHCTEVVRSLEGPLLEILLVYEE